MDAVQITARGGEPAWSGTFDHPEYGKLTFTVKRTPRNKDWLNHAVTQEQIAPGLTNGGGSGVLAAAIAGMMTFIDRPVISEDRVEDPDNPDHVTVTQVRYDPLEDESIDYPVQVWLDFMTWRAELLNKVDEVKNSSGVTSGPTSEDSSPEPTDSLPTTLA